MSRNSQPLFFLLYLQLAFLVVLPLLCVYIASLLCADTPAFVGQLYRLCCVHTAFSFYLSWANAV